MRHGFITEYDPRGGVLISTLAYEYPRGFHVNEHAHGSDQLIYAIRGVMHVTAGRSVWLIPPHFGLWIPARTYHSIKMPEAVSMRTLYMRHGLAPRLPPSCAVFHVTPLLRELIVETVRIKELRARHPLHCAIRDVLVAQLESASAMPTTVTIPQDPRARAIADVIMTNPAERRSLAVLCGSVGTSVRTIQRAFRREVGSDFEFWRRQVRLMKAIELLVSGRSVKETGFALGYRQPTAFVEMFRGILGTTPGAWTHALHTLKLN
ncbi:MAG TPA: helix-turn-helix transcriptional regulator [Bryobacteraceae bacterium]|nr:helix-turn-helix transcriptional regulator [Bryobacteraceae bacterium]